MWDSIVSDQDVGVNWKRSIRNIDERKKVFFWNWELSGSFRKKVRSVRLEQFDFRRLDGSSSSRSRGVQECSSFRTFQFAGLEKRVLN